MHISLLKRSLPAFSGQPLFLLLHLASLKRHNETAELLELLVQVSLLLFLFSPLHLSFLSLFFLIITSLSFPPSLPVHFLSLATETIAPSFFWATSFSLPPPPPPPLLFFFLLLLLFLIFVPLPLFYCSLFLLLLSSSPLLFSSSPLPLFFSSLLFLSSYLLLFFFFFFFANI